MSRTVLFNVQFAYRERADSGSAVRPAALRAAFEAAGWEVREVSGHRRARAAEVRRLLPDLARLDPETTLLYAESSTVPHVFDGRTHLPGPSPDLELARAARRHGIRSGLFYRDMYWRFLTPSGLRERAIAALYAPFYRAELRAYAAAYDVLFAPTASLLADAPEVRGARIVPLPPGAPLRPPTALTAPRTPGLVVHVGGVTDGRGVYDLEPLVRGAEAAGAPVRFICRPGEWAAARSHYEPAPGLTVHHATGAEKDALLASADLAGLVFAPHAYRARAFPVKLFEYLEAGLPIVASGPSEAADFVAAHGVGWAVEATPAAVADLLAALYRDPQAVAAVRARIPAVLAEHRWTARVDTIASTLLAP